MANDPLFRNEPSLIERHALAHLVPKDDAIVLGSQTSPGRAVVRNLKKTRAWDNRKGYGQDGAVAVYMGEELATFDVEFSLWEPRHFAEWIVFSKVFTLRDPTTRAPLALGILHDTISAAPFHVSAVVVTGMTGLEQVDDGLWSCVITFLEYRPPKPVVGKPKVAIPAVAKPTPTAQGWAEIETNRLLAEQDALGVAIANVGKK